MEKPGPGEKGTLHRRSLLDLFFTRPLPSRTGDMADFPNIEKQIERFRQNEKTEKFIPNEETGQGHSYKSKGKRCK